MNSALKSYYSTTVQQVKEHPAHLTLLNFVWFDSYCWRVIAALFVSLMVWLLPHVIKATNYYLFDDLH